jgi:predicted MFS family arabinose efflux permease
MQLQMASNHQSLPRVVIMLSIVSLLNDAASEMITPLLPLVVASTLGGGPLVVSLIEGLAEATSSLLKLASGWVADRGWSHRRLLLGGYLLSNVTRPLIGFAGSWPTVMGLRFFDRAGKGIRTSPRDAVIAGAVPAEQRGRAFGFHRAMDHTGAVVGPLLVWPLLAAGVPIQHVFLASALPGLLVMLMLWFGVPTMKIVVPAAVAWPRWSSIDRSLRGLIVAAAALTVSTLPEALLVLWVNRVGGIDITRIPLLWAAAHVIKVCFAYSAGMVSDRVGRLPVVIGGWTARVVVMICIAFGAHGVFAGIALFLIYAGALACTEAAERALVGDFAPVDQRGTAFGTYHFVCGLLALPSAALFGWLWESAGVAAAFAVAAFGTAFAACVLVVMTRRQASHN